MAKFSQDVLAKIARKPGGIEVDDVELVLADPERDFPSRSPGSNRHIYSRHIGGRLLLVIVEPDDREEVVTAYYPTPHQRRRTDA
jgi:hypothetical protein